MLGAPAKTIHRLLRTPIAGMVMRNRRFFVVSSLQLLPARYYSLWAAYIRIRPMYFNSWLKCNTIIRHQANGSKPTSLFGRVEQRRRNAELV